MLEKIKKILKDANIEEADSLLNDVQEVYEKAKKVEALTEEVNGLESKVKDLNDVYTQSSSTLDLLKAEFNATDVDQNFIKDLKEKINSNDKTGEVKNLEGVIKGMKEEHEKNKSQYESQIFDLKLNEAIAKSGHQINATGRYAQELIMSELKKGATFDDRGELIYEKDGLIERKDGLPVSLADKISSMKENEDFTGLFKTDAKGGSGTETVGSSVSTGNYGSLADRMRNAGLDV